MADESTLVMADRFTDDFGPLVSRRSLYGERAGSYVVEMPIYANVYFGDNTFTVVLDPFEQIIGQGHTESEAIQDATAHLIHSRDFYGRLDATRGTSGAKRQRVLMLDHLAKR